MKNKKKEILKTASKLFSEFSFSDVSMEKIAQKLGITKPALYYYFKSKKEIYFEVLNEAFEKLKKEIEKKVSLVKSKEEILSKTIEGYLEFCLKEKNLFRLLHLNPPKNSQMKSKLEKIKKQIDQFFQKKLKKVSKNPEFSQYLLGALDGIVMRIKNFSKKEFNPKEIASQISKVFFLLNQQKKHA